MGTKSSKRPLVYNHNQSPRSPKNRAAAKAREWAWDEDWYDYIDENNFRVSGAYHVPREQDIRC